MKIKLARFFSKLWCSLPGCWKYNWQGYYMVHFFRWNGGKVDVWYYVIPSGLDDYDL